jgi:hypothetical protein
MSQPDVFEHARHDDQHSDSGSGDARQSLLEEFYGSIKDFTSKVAQETGSNGDSKTGPSQLGDLTLTGEAGGDGRHTVGVLQGETKGDAVGLLGAGPEVHKSERESIARRYETIAKTRLEQAHAFLQYTTDGSAPKEIAYQDSFALSSQQSLEQIARSQLGPNATDQQVKTYAQALYDLNESKVTYNAAGDEELPAGKIKLPGQTRQGTIVYRVDEGGQSRLVSRWNDGTMLVQRADGTSEARYKDGDYGVTMTWSRNDVTKNGEARSKYVVTNPGTGDGYFEDIRKATDSQGRLVETSLKDGAPQSVRITDKFSNIYEFTPGRDGQLHGKKTNRGAVVESDVFMTGDGRIYTKETSKAGEATRKYEDGDTEKYDKRGRLVERNWMDDRGRSVKEIYTPGKKFPDQLKVTDKEGSVVELKMGKDGEFHGTRKEASGAVVDADVGMPGDGRYAIFSRKKEADGSLTRSFESGFVEKLDKDGNRIYTEGLDKAKRKFSADFTAGENTPHTYRLELAPGQKPIEFKRTGNNRYVADDVSASGSKVGTIELLPNDALRYQDNSGKNVRAVHPDGRTLKVTELSGGARQFTEEKDGQSHSVLEDANGRKTREVWTTNERHIQLDFTYGADGKPTPSMEIRDLTGLSVTELKYDEKSGTLRGEREDYMTWWGDEKVVFDGRNLIYRDASGDISRVEKFVKEDGQLAPKFVKMDYDADSGALTRALGSFGSIRESYSPGRTEIVLKNGHTTGYSITGDMSYAGPSGTNEAMVFHGADNAGVMIGADNKVTIWDKNGKRTEELSATEQSFLAKNPDIDKRDAAELHRRLSPDQQKIDAFYKSLERIETANNLTASEKASLRQNLVRHVAFPAEIYQGKSPTCNVSVVQREIAMTSPDKYADFVVGAVSDGKHATSDGTEIRFNQDNLKMADSSGRDLASRIFQTAAVNVILYPQGKALVNTETGVGEIRTILSEYQNWWNDENEFVYGSNAKSFQGLFVDQIADALGKLTGENRGGVYVDSAEELAALYRANGDKPLTLAVNGSEYPFDNAGPVGDGKGENHVVTIVGIDNGPPVKFLVQNQWGLQSDRSTALTAIDAEDLMFNITAGGRKPGYAVGRVPGNNPKVMYDLQVRADGTVDLTRACELHDNTATTKVCLK